MFDALEMSLTVLEQLAPVESKIRLRRKSLADEIGRAGESVALNVSEGRARAGLDRADFYRRAAGSANELTTALRLARARGIITAAEHAAIEAPLDRVRAMLWRLTRSDGESRGQRRALSETIGARPQFRTTPDTLGDRATRGTSARP